MKQIRLSTPNTRPNYYDLARLSNVNWNPDGKQVHTAFSLGYINDSGAFQQTESKTFSIANVPERQDPATGEALPPKNFYDAFMDQIEAADLSLTPLKDLLLNYYATILKGTMEEV